MNKDALKNWANEFFERHESRCCDDDKDRAALVAALVRELPGVVVRDDDLEVLDASLEASYQQALKDEAEEPQVRPDGKLRVSYIIQRENACDVRRTITEFRAAVAERRAVLCPECKTAPPYICKMSCDTQRHKGKGR